MSLLDTVLGVGQVATALFGKNKTRNNQQTATDSSARQTGAGFTSVEDLIEELIRNSSTTSNQQATDNTTNERSSSSADSRTTQSETAGGQRASTERVGSTGRETQTTLQFDRDVMGQLNDLLTGITGQNSALNAGQGALSSRIASVGATPAFDVDAYVDGIMASATSRANEGLESDVNNLASAVGSSGSGNSMVALLNNRLRNDTAANLAGIEADARLRGQTVRAQESSELSELARSGADGTLGLIQSLMGATSSTEVASQLQQDTRGNVTETSRADSVIAGRENATSNTTGTSRERTAGSQTTDQIQDRTTSQMTNQLTAEQLNSQQLTNTNQSGETKAPYDLFGNLARLFRDSSAAA